MPAFNSYTAATTASTSDLQLIWQGGTVKTFALPYSWDGTTMTLSGANRKLVLQPDVEDANALEFRRGSDGGLKGWITGRGFATLERVSTTKLDASVGGGTMQFTWSGHSLFLDFDGAKDGTELFRISAPVVLRDGANGQSFIVSNGYTDSGNYSQFAIRCDGGGNVTVGPERAGTGAAPDLWIQTNGALRWRFSGNAGHIVPASNNTYTIGSAGSNVSAVWSSSLIVGNGQGILSGQSFGTFVFEDGGGAPGSCRILVGGTSNAFPALKRSGTSLKVRLADDSADAPLSTGDLTIGGGTAIKQVLSATASLAFASTSGPVSQTIAVTGAAVGDVVVLGIPSGAEAVDWTAVVTSTNVVTVTCTSGSYDNGSGAAFRVAVLKF